MSGDPLAVLVTGATSGIGLACAQDLVRAGHQVFAGHRTAAGAGVLRREVPGAEPVRLDVTKPATIAAALDRIAGTVGAAGLQGLVNNAGVAVGGPVEHVPTSRWRQQFDVNVFGPVAVTQAALPLLRRGRGCVVFIGSVGGRISVPLLAPYSASKAALEAIAESLRAEVASLGVRVVIVEPGAVATPMWEAGRRQIERIGAELPAAAIDDYRARVEETVHLLEGLEAKAMPAARVASIVTGILLDPSPRDRYAISPAPAEPEPRTTADRIAALSPDRRRLLELLSKGGAAPSGEREVSCSEERLLFLDELVPENAAYNVPAAMRLHGRLDIARLETAVGDALASFDAFRTTYRRRPTGPVAVIADALSFSIPVDDVSELGPGAEARMRALIVEEVARPFDLTTGPLVRCRLVRLGPDDHVLVVVIHHIVCDGWSLAVVLRAIGERFGGLAPTAVAMPFAAVVAHERRALATGALDTSIGYWATRLRGAPILDLPTDRPRPIAPSGAGDVVRFAVPTTVRDSLVRLARDQHTTLYTVLLAAFAVLLHRYTDGDDITIGTPVANRSGRGLSDAVGFLVNTLVWRLPVDPTVDFAALLDGVRREVIGGLDHQDAPFDKVVEAVHPVRRPGENPLFRVMFVLQNVDLPRDVLPDLSLGPVGHDDGLLHHGALTLAALEVPNGTTKFDLTLQMEEVDGGLAAALEFDTDLFDPATVERMARHLTTLLAAVADGNPAAVGELPLLPADELAAVVDASAASAPPAETFVARFRRLAHEVGDQEAVIDGDRTVTYADLRRVATSVAHRLAGLGVEAGSVVGVCLERSALAIGAVLGVLEAGGAFLPIEPSLPLARRREQLDIAGTAALVTSAALVDEAWSGPSVLVDDLGEEDAGEVVDGPVAEVALDSLAYVIFTSGSTGAPKGVMVEHRSLANALGAWEQVYGIGDRVRRHLQVASFSFDVWIGDLVRALGSGGCLILCPTDAVLDPGRLHALLDDHRVDFVEVVPVVARLLVEHLERVDDVLHTVRVVAVGSDVWHAGDHERLRRRCPEGCLVVNSFGLTEATIDNAVHVGPAPAGPAEAVVPIGHPLPNTTMYVLDRAQRPVPTGVRGELYVGGDCVARGYVGRPDLTAERFVTDPFSPRSGARMYRTGDLARRRADGAIECLGRIDRQVKVNGVRIELGEVECALTSHPTVNAAVVVPRALAGTGTGLIAYVTAASDVVVDPAAVLAHAAAILPRHARPGRVVVLDALPMTVSGKVDIAALPIVDAAVDRPRDPPRSDAECLVAGVWREALDGVEVWLDDDFFELGGHSLLLGQIAAALSEASGRAIPLRTLLEHTTVRELAAALVTHDGDAVEALPIGRAHRRLAVVDVDGRGRIQRVREGSKA